MKVWFSAQEIADLNLPGMPTSKMGVSQKALRDGWTRYESLARPRAGSQGGGGFEYHLDLLPLVSRLAYSSRFLPQHDDVEQSPDAAPDCTGRGALLRDARAAILRAVEKFTAASGLSVLAADRLFAAHYDARTAGLSDWVYDEVKTTSERSIARWRSQARKNGIEALATDAAQNRKGTGALDRANDGAVRSFALALIATQPHLSVDTVRTLCRDEFGDQITVGGKAIDMPPLRAFQRLVASLKAENEVLLTKVTNPDRYRSVYAHSGTGAFSYVTEPNMLWQIDASPLDMLCVDGRHSIYVAIDIATRRLVVMLSKTPRASAVALLIRKGVTLYGVPKRIKTDNGSDFVARDTQRLFANLDIEMDVSTAYSPEQKGHVERAIQTIQHGVGPLLNGFIGHNVTDRTQIEQRKAFAQRLGESVEQAFTVENTAAQVQAKIDEWLELVYHQRKHGGLNGLSPAMAAAQSTKPIRMVDERALDLLLMPVAKGGGLRHATKFGIRIDKRNYSCASILPETQVFVRMDPADMGRIYCYSPDQTAFLGIAICPELAGIHPETHHRALKEARAELVAEGTKRLRADMRRISNGPELIQRVLEVARRDAPNVVAMPKRETRHETPALASALSAVHPKAQKVDKRVAEEQARLIAEMDQPTAPAPKPSNVRRLPESPKDRYRRALNVRAALETNSASPEDARWLGSYEQSAEFKGHENMHRDFGDTYFGGA